ncbi:MAG: pyridoxal phosphate-dependent aminotransferase [Alphaproteobacteria bacterium]|nr:pyridoxal phosphate-dependent aminotransferase [Alphaproteobacteria bacterium SS10]
MGGLRPEARNAPPSGIVEMVNHGIGRDGLIPLWAGEGDLPTPEFIRAGAVESLDAGETFYTYQRGIPPLREAISNYMRRLYGGAFPFTYDRFYVTGSGMQAVQLAIAAVAGAGASMVIPTPTWPNFAAAIELTGGEAITVPMDFIDDRWQLDLEKLLAAIRPDTTAIFLNSPGNPTGWTASEGELRAILEGARQRDLWIVADEIYARYYFGAAHDGFRAPSFHDVAEPDDKILYVNTMSKNWAMTGWRVGWLEAPPALGQVIENLIQYSTSGVATFMQRASVVALDQGDDFITEQVARAAKGRQIVADAVAGLNRVRFTPPDGAFYAFFTIDGIEDVRQLGFDLIDQAGIGLAPGTAFGPGGEAFMRLCFARGEESLTQAMDRLVKWMQAN